MEVLHVPDYAGTLGQLLNPVEERYLEHVVRTLGDVPEHVAILDLYRYV